MVFNIVSSVFAQREGSHHYFSEKNSCLDSFCSKRHKNLNDLAKLNQLHLDLLMHLKVAAAFAVSMRSSAVALSLCTCFRGFKGWFKVGVYVFV